MATEHGRTLRFASSDRDLVDGFRWAVDRSLAWVQRGPAALPSYWAGLTDRPMFYSRDLAHQALGGHLLGLDNENFSMLRHFALSSTPARRYYPLWSFTFDGAPAANDYRSDAEFVRETPAPFELVEAALRQAQWTGDRRYISDAVFRGFYTHTARDFVQLHDVLGTGVAGEPSMRDIFEGRPSYHEGSSAPALAVAGDGIASQWAAMRAISDLFDSAELVALAASEAARLRQQFENQWWQEDAGRYATGFSADGAVTDFAYEASWFPAVKGLLQPGNRAGRHLDHLSAALAVAPPENIEAITYLPEAFLRYGRDVEGLTWIHRLLESRADYPEVPFTAVAHLTVELTGVRLVGSQGIATRSHISDGWIEAANVPVRGGWLSIRHEGADLSALSNASRRPVRWLAEFPNGVREIEVGPGGEAVVEAP